MLEIIKYNDEFYVKCKSLSLELGFNEIYISQLMRSFLRGGSEKEINLSDRHFIKTIRNRVINKDKNTLEVINIIKDNFKIIKETKGSIKSRSAFLKCVGAAKLLECKLGLKHMRRKNLIRKDDKKVKEIKETLKNPDKLEKLALEYKEETRKVSVKKDYKDYDVFSGKNDIPNGYERIVYDDTRLTRYEKFDLLIKSNDSIKKHVINGKYYYNIMDLLKHFGFSTAFIYKRKPFIDDAETYYPDGEVSIPNTYSTSNGIIKIITVGLDSYNEKYIRSRRKFYSKKVIHDLFMMERKI